MKPFRARLTTPAKINLSLHVRGRRADGYHELDSVFVPITLADDIELRCEPTTGDTVIACECEDRPELGGSNNLAARAAKGYLDRIDARAAVHLRITKRIWVAAGLGGGSSDAAATLRALDAGFRAQESAALPAAELEVLALSLGADVPFFLDPRPARAQGIGERLTPVPDVPPLELVLVNPASALSTAEVYAGLGLAPGTQASSEVAVPPDFSSRDRVIRQLVNDLQPIATKLCPRIGELKRALSDRGALATSLSGSGPTVFGLFAEAQQARRVAEEMALIKDTYAVCARAACGLTPSMRSPYIGGL